ncbi:MAG TPA: hypothetical protein ENK57_12690, partial [Polyangiaceae bacterium]|nr:hypothetical protein [Polyangiaceae bacterium]
MSEAEAEATHESEAPSPVGLRFDVPPADEAEVVLRVARSFGFRALSSALGYVLALAVLLLLVRELWALGPWLWICAVAIIGSQAARAAVSSRLSVAELGAVPTYYWAFFALTMVGAVGWSSLSVAAFSVLGTAPPAVLTVLVVGVISAGSLGTLSQSDVLHATFLVSILMPTITFCAIQYLLGRDGYWIEIALLMSVAFAFVLVQGRRLRTEFVRGVLSRVHLDAAR